MPPDVLSEIGTPLWWRSGFLESQSSRARFFRFDSVCIPFINYDDRVEIGLLGPYGGALDSAPLISAGLTRSAWQEFHREIGKKILVRLPPASHFPELRFANQSALKERGALQNEQNHTEAAGGV